MVGIDGIMLGNAHVLMDAIGASAIIIFDDAAIVPGFWKGSDYRSRLIVVTQRADGDAYPPDLVKEIKGFVRLPAVRFTRLGQIKLSVINCVTEGLIDGADKVVCLTGLERESGGLDTLIAIDLAVETEVLSTPGISRELLRRVRPEVIETVLSIAIELSVEGREGGSVGTTFVIGDHEKVDRLSRPLIMNPFKGYPEEARIILDERVHETIKEFALLDGAFVIREDGVVMSAGVHLDAALDSDGHMPGLGCRHMAAAGITDVTDAVSITVSGSTGIVRIFRKGSVVFELERPVRPALWPPR